MNNTPRILRIYLVNGTPDSSIATNVNTVIKPKLEKLPAINIKTILTNVNRTFTLVVQFMDNRLTRKILA